VRIRETDRQTDGYAGDSYNSACVACYYAKTLLQRLWPKV